MADYEEYPEEFPEEMMEEEELPAGEPDTFLGKVTAKTPWWAISVGAHALAVMVLSFIVVFGLPLPDADAVVLMPKKKMKRETVFEPKTKSPSKKPLDHKKAVDDPIYRKYAEESDHNESADDEEFKKMKGDSLDFVSDKPFQGKGTYDVIGGGGGGGGRYGGRLGGKRDLVRSGGGGIKTENAVLEALRWLARHQNPDGSWSTTGYTGHCNKVLPDNNNYGGGACTPNPGFDDFNAGNTGLAMLAFLGAGYSHLSQDVYDGIRFGDVVKNGLQWMMNSQDPEGCVGNRNAQKYMYNHTLCALALSEAYGLTGSQLFRDQAQKAVDFTVAAQNPGKGWRYSYKSGDNDSSVSGWAVMVLKSAELSALNFPRTAYDGARNWYDEVTEEGGYPRVGYTHRGTGKVYTKENQHFNHQEALTAIAVMSRIFIDKNKQDPRLRNGADLLLRGLPKWSGNDIDFYYWYYASLALFQFDGPKGAKWRTWNEPMKNALVENQNLAKGDCRRGSWETVGRWCCEGGRVYATAINALTLEVYYRYANVFGAGR